MIRRSAEHLADLIDGILDISKIENGILRLNRDKVALAEFLDQIVDMFRLQAAAKGIEFVYQRPPNLPAFVHVDQKRLRQILINLLSNAIKYTERGNATLDRALSQPGGRVRSVGYRRRHSGTRARARVRALRARPGRRTCAPSPAPAWDSTITKLLTQIMGGEINATQHRGRGHDVHGAPAAVRSDAGANAGA